MSYLHLARVQAGPFRYGGDYSNSESSASADEYGDVDSDNKYDTNQYRGSDFPTQFLGVPILRGVEREQQTPANTIAQGKTQDISSGPGAVPRPKKTNGGNGDNQRAQQHIEANDPPSPWRQSTAKQEIINDLKDATSDIHLHIGLYGPKNWKEVKFRPLWEKYGTHYNFSNFTSNLKRLLMNYKNGTGDFKAEVFKAEPWYTSTNNRSAAYTAVFALHGQHSRKYYQEYDS